MLTYWRVLAWLVFHLRLYSAWSQVYRFFYQRAYYKYNIKSYKTWGALVEDLQKLQWTADGWKQLWDAIEHPGYVQAIIDKRIVQPTVGTDCDAFASWACAVVEGSREALSEGNLPIKNVHFMSIQWLDDDRLFSGHNVCLIEHDNGMWSYVDYDRPHTYTSFEGLAMGICRSYGGPKSINVAYQIYNNSYQLKVVKNGSVK